jgi:sulfate permease, SulP family
MILLTYLNKKGFFSEFSDKRQLKTDLLSGLTVALALIPEAIAFSFVAKVDPMVGLHAAFIVGIITAIFGGRPGMISGATGAMAVVMTAMVMTYGIEYLFVTLVLAGVLQMLFGLAKMGKFVRLIPHPVMLGFVNGLAIIIFLAQMEQFKTVDGSWITGVPAMVMGGLILLTMAIMHFLPKYTKAIPSGLAAIGTVTLLALYVPDINTHAKTIAGYLADNDSVLK